ncbi:hypothetical protein QTH87_24520 [Variovorax sp. J22P168]|uniref:hypothetical protein n=1 Tax=Variovorax jilinensis TaxID=3053513 RepID=UPI0025784534|nr:hypothetical protein [Variovorax sp. J22P168]MDM0015625.1 hypothetical protein [Variovorax sp. J22P168]
MSTDRSEAIRKLQALAVEERLELPEEDEVLIESVLDRLEELEDRRRLAARRKARRIAIGIGALCALLALALLFEARRP